MAGIFDELFATNESKRGLPAGFLSRMAQIESRMNPRAQNPNSSAGGLFQFIDSTAKDYGLTNKFDPVASTDAAARLAADNRSILAKALGREPTAGELYLAHQQGAGGASKLLSNPDAPAASIVGAKAASLNGGAGLTAGEFANKWTSKFGNIGTGGITGTPPFGNAPTRFNIGMGGGNFGINGPIGKDAPALPTAAVATMQPDNFTATAPEADKGLLENKDVTGGLDMLAKAFGGGKGQQQQQEAMVPLSNYSQEQAARAVSAQQLMSQLLMKNKVPRGILG